jgi:hypothetical protein
MCFWSVLTLQDLRDFDSSKKKRIPKRKVRMFPVPNSLIRFISYCAEKKVVDQPTDHSAVTTEGLEKDGWLKEDVNSGREREYAYPEVCHRLQRG